jgi:hypothetical protein
MSELGSLSRSVTRSISSSSPVRPPEYTRACCTLRVKIGLLRVVPDRTITSNVGATGRGWYPAVPARGREIQEVVDVLCPFLYLPVKPAVTHRLAERCGRLQCRLRMYSHVQKVSERGAWATPANISTPDFTGL